LYINSTGLNVVERQLVQSVVPRQELPPTLQNAPGKPLQRARTLKILLGSVTQQTRPQTHSPVLWRSWAVYREE
jgi:hypothetical protein